MTPALDVPPAIYAVGHVEAFVVNLPSQTVRECANQNDVDCIPVAALPPLDTDADQQAYAKWAAIKESETK